MLLGSENTVPSVLSWGKSPSRVSYTPKESKFTETPLSIYRHTELFFPLCPQGSWVGTSSWSNSCCTQYHDPLTLGAAIESGLLWKIFFLMVDYLMRSLSFLPTNGLPGGTTQELIRHVCLYTDSYRLSSRFFWEPSQLCYKQGSRGILGREIFLKSIYQIVPESLLWLNWETLLFQLTALTRQIAQGQSFPEDQLCWELAPRRVTLTYPDTTVRPRTTFSTHGLNESQCRATHSPKSLYQVIPSLKISSLHGNTLFSLIQKRTSGSQKRGRFLLQSAWPIMQGSCNHVPEWMFLR